MFLSLTVFPEKPHRVNATDEKGDAIDQVAVDWNVHGALISSMTNPEFISRYIEPSLVDLRERVLERIKSDGYTHWKQS